MKSAVWGFAAPGMVPGLIAAPAVTQDQAKINPTDPQPTCPMCPGAYIPLTELEAYAQKALAEKLLDKAVRTLRRKLVVSATLRAHANGHCRETDYRAGCISLAGSAISLPAHLASPDALAGA